MLSRAPSLAGRRASPAASTFDTTLFIKKPAGGPSASLHPPCMRGDPLPVDPSSNQATTLESHMIHMIQELFGQTLRGVDEPNHNRS
jgi:hypothetical protein